MSELQYKAILVHWAEIALKGKNRPKFVDRLAGNIRQAMRGLPVAEIRKLPSRLWITAHGGEHFGDEAFARLRTVYGISSFSPVVRCGLDLEQMKETALKLAKNHQYESFRISARRAFKDLPFRSQEVAGEIGAYVLEHIPAKVKMKGADLDIQVELLPQGAYFYTEKILGLQGLPVGVTGKVCTLLSGGIDSPVAAYRMMRRGCRVVLVHFHSHPFVTRASLEKAEELAEVLARYQTDVRFWAVPFGELQRTLVEKVPPPLRVVLYRRYMLRIAGALAARERCRALVTGDALAQVASQTLTNMIAIEEAAPMMVLRPLIALETISIDWPHFSSKTATK